MLEKIKDLILIYNIKQNGPGLEDGNQQAEKAEKQKRYAEILHHQAENRKAKNMTRPKKIERLIVFYYCYRQLYSHLL